MLRRLALAGMVALLVGAGPLAQTPEPAQDDSIEVLRTRANAGDAEAQYNLGVAYRDSEGVPQDNVEAVAWFRQAAEQGDANAQYNLGAMYVNGRGVPQDAVEVYKWFNLATTYTDASTREEFAKARDSVAEFLTPQQQTEGQRLTREWRERVARVPNPRFR